MRPIATNVTCSIMVCLCVVTWMSPAKKRLNRLRCHSASLLRWAQGTMYSMGIKIPTGEGSILGSSLTHRKALEVSAMLPTGRYNITLYPSVKNPPPPAIHQHFLTTLTILLGCPKSWQLHVQIYFGAIYSDEFKPHNFKTTYYTNYSWYIINIRAL